MEIINPDVSSVGSTGKTFGQELTAPHSALCWWGLCRPPVERFCWGAPSPRPPAVVRDLGCRAGGSYSRSWTTLKGPGGLPQLLPGVGLFSGWGGRVSASGPWASEQPGQSCTCSLLWAQKLNTKAWCRIRTFPWIWAFYKVCCILQCDFITS